MYTQQPFWVPVCTPVLEIPRRKWQGLVLAVKGFCEENLWDWLGCEFIQANFLFYSNFEVGMQLTAINLSFMSIAFLKGAALKAALKYIRKWPLPRT